MLRGSERSGELNNEEAKYLIYNTERPALWWIVEAKESRVLLYGTAKSLGMQSESRRW